MANVISVKLTEPQWKRLAALSRAAGLAPSAYLVAAALGSDIPGQPTDAEQAGIQEVFDSYLRWRSYAYPQRHGGHSEPESRRPVMNPRLAGTIGQAIREFGVAKCKAAAAGLFLSSFYAGENREGRCFHEPWRPFVARGNSMDHPVNRLSELYYQWCEQTDRAPGWEPEGESK